MGTRADYYVGRGQDAKWLCSTAWDGYPDGIDDAVLKATTEDEFIKALSAFAEPRDDVTKPDQGWPWPWETSHTTDYAYAFDGGQVWVSCSGDEWHPVQGYGELSDDDLEALGEMPADAFPDMSDIKNVTFGARSGILLFSG